jgi:DNA polymerase-3 subunit epsilon
LLAEVYLELIDARQAMLGLIESSALAIAARNAHGAGRVRPQPLLPRITDEERAAHRSFIATLGESAIWKDYGLAAAAGPLDVPSPLAGEGQRALVTRTRG